MKFISGKKLMMTQIWSGDQVMAVTPVQAGPCVITQVKNTSKDGYEALQLAFGVRKEKNVNKPQRGHFKKAGVTPALVREFRTEDASKFQIGDVVSVGAFGVGETIDVAGVSKGRGFQGVVKRHGFGGFRATHGNKDQERMPGSIGPKGPAHVFKGTRMAGRMGGDRVTVKNLEVAAIDEEKNLIYVKGAVPGAINSYVFISAQGELQVNLKKTAAPEVSVEENEETPIVEEAPAVNEESATPASEEVSADAGEAPEETQAKE